MKTINEIIQEKNTNNIYSFSDDFNNIIINRAGDYSGNNKQKLKSFFNDLMQSGCISGIISDFVYNTDCKNFYVEHLDDLEDFKSELESRIGEPIKNRYSLPHYVFMCHLCFEEYAYNLENEIFND